MNTIHHARVPVLVAIVLCGVALAAGDACADEILYRDAETCEEITVNAPEITSETWTEVKYRDRARGPELSVPSALVLQVKRDPGSSSQAKELLSAIAELQRGKIADARRRLEVMSTGGMKQDLESGKMVYRDFARNDPKGRGKRPAWTSEYAHFYYAKALYLEGIKKKDNDLLNQAYMALVDQKIPEELQATGEDGKIDRKATTGGFLKRFAGGNSRFLPEAMTISAKALVGLKRWPDAEKAFKSLGDQAISVDIGPSWAYESKLGPGSIAEARGKYLDAENAYKDAASFMRLLLKNETRACFRREIGRLHSRARMKAAGVMLQRAEKNKSPVDFRALRAYIQKSMPEQLAKEFAALPAGQRVPLVDGARDPEAQAVMQNGLGLAFLQEGKFEDALLAFRRVEIMYFQVPEEHARALYYLAQAAEKAATQATGDAKTLYENYRTEALNRLKADHPDSRWVQ